MKYKYLMNGKSLELNSEKCVGCGMCINVCPHNVFKMSESKALIADRSGCMECGACSINCPASAIKVKVGVGCAAAIIIGMIKKKAPECGCTGSSCCSFKKNNKI
jgi:NAD-dependent dihydropyrimidine dehydrogenase PreA subunit